MDRPGRREHREPTVRPKIAAVGVLELKYRKRAQTLCGAGRQFGETGGKLEHGRTHAPVGPNTVWSTWRASLERMTRVHE